MTNRSAALLPLLDARWRTPFAVRRLFSHRADLVAACDRDGIPQVGPIVAAFGAPPAEVRSRIGKGLWRRVHHSELRHNVYRAVLKVRTRLPFDVIMSIPPAALREAPGMVKSSGETVVGIAARIAGNRSEMREAVMHVRDILYMGGRVNEKWSTRRLREEHDRLARKMAMGKASAVPFAEPWSDEIDGFRITRLISEADFVAEGYAMHHCIAGYSERAKRGHEIAFRIEGPERASASFSHTGHLELKGPCNRAVSAACRRAVRKIEVEFPPRSEGAS